jgi:hypothetical protein
LEKLWADYESKLINEGEASSQFFQLRTSIKEKIERSDNDLHIKQFKHLLVKTDKQEKHYFNNRYGREQ